ncbi:MAG TPA: glutamate synthase central domain-containing protein, partial [Vicinamibacterales bacterium]|nr:glutamate synthase central domain-containing protein [Vicinamibacterales bacterium]
MLDRSSVARAPLYRPELESDACGVGLVADASGRRSHAVVERALEALRRLAHRGPARNTCPDGAGILTQIPWTLLERELPARARAAAGSRVVGMFFLPAGSRGLIAPAIERTLSDAGWRWLRWRSVPMQTSRLHSAARRSMPDIWQLVAAADRQLPDADRALHGARLRIERQAAEFRLPGFSVVSLSTATVVYKGLVTPNELPDVFQDLQDPLFQSALAIVHQRFSTNTAPEWRLAQPFRMLAHNGEINTIHGNRIWMRARARDARCLGAYAGERVLDETGSDSQSLDEVVELLRHSGFSLAHAISRLVPPAWEQDSETPPEVAAFHAYQACFSEPWDGPAALAFTDGRVIGAALDRNGFRPLRYLKTTDRQLLLGSEAGIFDVPETDVTCRGRVGPGELIVVDTVDGTIRETTSVRKVLARQRPYRQLLARTVVMPQRTGPPVQRTDAARGETLVRLQRAFGYTREEVEMILRVMADQGEEAVGSMGDDAPIAPLSEFGRTLPDYFRQRFAQVTNPPMDPLREACVMS